MPIRAEKFCFHIAMAALFVFIGLFIARLNGDPGELSYMPASHQFQIISVPAA